MRSRSSSTWVATRSPDVWRLQPAQLDRQKRVQPDGVDDNAPRSAPVHDLRPVTGLDDEAYNRRDCGSRLPAGESPGDARRAPGPPPRPLTEGKFRGGGAGQPR